MKRLAIALLLLPGSALAASVSIRVSVETPMGGGPLIAAPGADKQGPALEVAPDFPVDGKTGVFAPAPQPSPSAALSNEAKAAAAAQSAQQGQAEPLGVRIERTRTEFKEAAQQEGAGSAGIQKLSQGVFDGVSWGKRPDGGVVELLEPRIGGEEMRDVIESQLVLQGVPVDRLPRIDLPSEKEEHPYDYHYVDNVMRLGVDESGRVELGGAQHEAHHAFEWLTGIMTPEEAQRASHSAKWLRRAIKKAEDPAAHGMDPETAQIGVHWTKTLYMESPAEARAFIRQYSAVMVYLSSRLKDLEARFESHSDINRMRDSLKIYAADIERLRPATLPPVEHPTLEQMERAFAEMDKEDAEVAAAEEGGDGRLSALRLRNILSDKLVSKGQAKRLLGLNPERSGTMLSQDERAQDSTVLKISDELVVKTFHPRGLSDLFSFWSPAVRALKNELFTRQYIRLFFDDVLNAPRSIGYVAGLIFRRGVLAMEAVDAKVDGAKLTVLPMNRRIHYALAMLVTGGEDTNSNNALFARDKGPLDKDAMTILDFARALTEIKPDANPSGFGVLGVRPWTSDNYYNSVSPSGWDLIRRHKTELRDPKKRAELKKILRGLGLHGNRRRRVMRILGQNADNVEAVLGSHMAGANVAFKRKILEAKLDMRMAGMMSEINLAAQESQYGGVYRDIVRFVLARHGLSEKASLKVSSMMRYALHPYELLVLQKDYLAGQPGGLIPDSDYRAALENWQGDPGDLREAFDQVNSWLRNPPELPPIDDTPASLPWLNKKAA